jgi:hypothetical protein
MCEEICSNSQPFDIGWRKSTSSTSQYYERRADVTKGGQNKSKNIWFAVQHSFALHLQACCERAICIHRRRREQMSSDVKSLTVYQRCRKWPCARSDGVAADTGLELGQRITGRLVMRLTAKCESRRASRGMLIF